MLNNLNKLELDEGSARPSNLTQEYDRNAKANYRHTSQDTSMYSMTKVTSDESSGNPFISLSLCALPVLQKHDEERK